MIMLYWSVGRDILARQTAEGWGARVIDRLAADLGRDFPEMTGLSALETSNICVPLLKHSQTRKSCNSLLHICPGAITSSSSRC
ncbi:DUF1016 N-terminal domain-containing protein [Pseudorhizobium endolithicum]|uniref:DUF1016 N-terminal domain-containing protein n=1 Tax=Pseudorhizobium endolithicum TaxID=1191678 RepID=UPI0022A872F9|nr:DUF1016 N-terminal domain-containing protein [Pseudorhizobium endolithicum]